MTTPKTAPEALEQIEAMISGGDRPTVNPQNAFEHWMAINRTLLGIRDIARAALAAPAQCDVRSGALDWLTEYARETRPFGYARDNEAIDRFLASARDALSLPEKAGSGVLTTTDGPNVDVLIQRLRAANAGGLREQAYQTLCGDAADILSSLVSSADRGGEA